LFKVFTIVLAEAEKADHIFGLAPDEFLNTRICQKDGMIWLHSAPPGFGRAPLPITSSA
jgi:hypothetical protein